MKITRRGFEFTLQNRQTIKLAQAASDTAWCTVCERRVRMLRPEAAARTIGITARELYRLIEADQVHFTETDGGQLRVCLDSLGETLEK